MRILKYRCAENGIDSRKGFLPGLSFGAAAAARQVLEIAHEPGQGTADSASEFGDS